MGEIKKALNNYDLDEITTVVLLRESADNLVYAIGEKNKKILRISKRLPAEECQMWWTHIFLTNIWQQTTVTTYWLRF